MRPGLSVLMSRRLACAAPCYCSSFHHGSVRLRHPGCTLPFLPCCSTVLQQSSLLHTTSLTTKRFSFSTEELTSMRDGLRSDNLRRPRKVVSINESEESDRMLQLIKQATAFMKTEEPSSQDQDPTAVAPPPPNTRPLNTFRGQNSSTPNIKSHNTETSPYFKKDAIRGLGPSTSQFSYSNVQDRDQNISSDRPYRGKTANAVSPAKQVYAEHRAMNGTPRAGVSGSFFENKFKASESNSTAVSSGRDYYNERQPEEKEGDFEGELNTDSQRFRRRYSRNRFYINPSTTPDLPANTMEKIREASQLLRHGTISSIPSPSSSSEELNSTRRGKFFPSGSFPQKTPPSAVDPETPPEQRTLPRPRGRGSRKRLETPESTPTTQMTDVSTEDRINLESPTSASSVQRASPSINKESLRSTESSHGFKQRASLAATRSASDAPPLAKSVPLSTPYARQVPRTGSEQLELMQAPVVSPPNSKLLRIALLGLPNSGKSTLVNALLEDRVCSVSNKPNTTRCLARAIYTTEDTQLVFLDTPGVVTPEQTIKYGLVGSVVQDAERSLTQADLLLLLHDCSSPFNRLGLHPRLLRVLALYPHIPAMLVMNKVDLVRPKQQLLKLTRMLTEGMVGGRCSHGATPPKGPRDPFRDITSDPNALVKRFLDSLDRNNPKDESLEEELPSDEDESAESDELVEATQQTQQVSFEHLISGEGPVVLPSEGTFTKFHQKIDVSDEDVLSGRVKLSEQQLANFLKNRKGWPNFQRVLLTSALTGDGVMDLRQVLEDMAAPAPWQYPAAMVTDQDPYQLATLTVREKFMDKFKYQLPYNLSFQVDNWELGDADCLIIGVRVICKEAGLVKLLVGASGCHIKNISQQAEQKLGQIFKADVRLRIIVSSEETPQKASKEQGTKQTAREQS